MLDFDIFILSHGRAEIITTDKLLRKMGYTGRIWIVIDDEDEQEELYRSIYGDAVLQFNKQKYFEQCEAGDNFTSRASSIYARMAIDDIAKEWGLTYYGMFDDDTQNISRRWVEGKSLRSCKITNFDEIVKAYIEFMKVDERFVASGFMNGGIIFGAESAQKIGRFVCNQMFLSTKKPQWIGRGVEDMITWLNINYITMTTYHVCVDNGDFETSVGGVQGDYGYVSQFKRLCYSPACSEMVRNKNGKIVNKFYHNRAWPCILSSKWKKEK